MEFHNSGMIKKGWDPNLHENVDLKLCLKNTGTNQRIENY